MTETDLLIAACALAGLIVASATLLKGWHGWLALKTRELDLAREGRTVHQGSPEGAARIEIADLKERIRKLEAIASGVDL